jgi:hypothetical protein
MFGMPSFEAILESIDAARPTVVVHAEEPSAAVSERLGPVGVDVEYEQPGPDGEERLTVERDGELLAAVSIATFLDHEPTSRVPWDPTAGEAELRGFLSTLSDVHFGSLDRGRLLDVSRSIEAHAWHHETGRLHAGFQRLSNLPSRRIDGSPTVPTCRFPYTASTTGPSRRSAARWC